LKTKNKKRATKPYVRNLVALEKPLILTLIKIVQFFDLNYNYFLTVSINRLQEFVYENKYLEKPNWRANYLTI